MSDGYSFEAHIQLAYRKAEAGEWDAAANQLQLASAIIYLTKEQRSLVVKACDYVNRHDLIGFSEIHYSIKVENKTTEKSFHHLKSQFGMSIGSIKAFIAWGIGLWVVLMMITILLDSRFVFFDIFITLGITILSVSAAALLVIIFRISSIDFLTNIGLLIFTSVLIPSIVALVRYMLNNLK